MSIQFLASGAYDDIMEYIIRVGIKILIHEAIGFDLGAADADRFLEEYPTRVFFVGNKLVESFSIPFGFTRRGGDILFLKPSGDFAQTITVE